MDLGLTNKVAFVAASTSGLGRASAVELAAEGARVFVTGRTQARVQTVVEQVLEAGGEADGAVMDVEDLASVEHAAATCEAVFGPIDVLVLNGPGPRPGKPTTVEPKDVDEAMNRLVKPHIALVNRCLPHMQKQGWGRIIAVGSVAVQTPSEQLVLSSMGRMALAGYLKALSLEVGASGVTVNVVHPGRILTPRIDQLDADAAQREGVSPQDVRERFENSIPVKRLGKPEELAAAVVFYSSKEAAYITGTGLRVDGGSTPVL
ncbi:SDR family oxidoreductase [Gleimia hominis]|uniref:SDR family oxidoreductase n=1 Tax=Gleimia hominis TaxID=595468 RepID=A0ABU3ICC8_9ACTO|nr:SDR family oxidoreductase [Gleimia hominis]MDT3768034.1 SDR family oxidoreductase [Gleimia hominis]